MAVKADGMGINRCFDVLGFGLRKRSFQNLISRSAGLEVEGKNILQPAAGY